MDPNDILSKIKYRLSNTFRDRLVEVVLFGSAARNTAVEESDIDILVILDEMTHLGDDLRKSLDAVSPLAHEWEKRISIKPVSRYNYQFSDCPLYRHVKNEGIVV
jgi:uncharacterized protein